VNVSTLTTAQQVAIIACGAAYTAAMVLLFVACWWFTLIVLVVFAGSLWVLVRDDARQTGADIDELESWMDR
tara:strand:+ start:476 stop:691 length:216 start_codon:yes stop_codon:yes gene_type:complete